MPKPAAPRLSVAERVGQGLGLLLLPELRLLRLACEGILAALDYRNVQDYGITHAPQPGVPVVEVTYVNDAHQAAIMDVELRLTAALGAPPTEDEILAEYEKRFGPGPEAESPA
jgi:hypothetical protein